MQPFIIQVAIIIALSSACYLNTLNCDYTYDDPTTILKNKDVRPTTPLSQLFFNNFWGDSMMNKKSHGSYRPICVLTYRLNNMAFGLHPTSFHAVNIMLHSLSSVLAYWCLKVLSFSQHSSFVAAILFAVHPIHTESVASIVGRAELLAAIFFFLALISYVKSTKHTGVKILMPLALSAMAIPVAALSKEVGITVVGVMLFYETIACAQWNPRSPIRSLNSLLTVGTMTRMICIVTVTTTFMCLRLRLMHHIPTFTWRENIVAFSSTPVRQLTFAYLVPLNAWLLTYPWPLLLDYAYGTVPLISGWSDPRNLITVLFFVMLVASTVASVANIRRDQRLAFCLVLTVMPFFPASNLLFRVGFVIAERVLYLPSFGWCALVAVGFERTANLLKNSRRIRRIFLFLFYLVVVAFFIRTFVRNYDWMNNRTIMQAGLRYSQRNSKLFGNIALIYEEGKHWHEAFAYYYKSVTTQPNDGMAHYNVARMLQNLNEIKLAEEALLHARFLEPETPDIQFNLASLYYKPLNQTEKALQILEELVKNHPDQYNAWLLLGHICMKFKVDLAKAENAFQSILEVTANIDDPLSDLASFILSAQVNLCRIFEMKADPRKAVECFELLINDPGKGFLVQEITEIKARHPDSF